MKTYSLIVIFAFIGATTGIIKAQTSGICGDNLTWQLADSTLTISGSGAMYDYTYYAEGRPWYNVGKSIKTLVISDGVTAIGKYAFYQCTNLEFVTIPTSVTRLGEESFTACRSLTVITIPSTIDTIESRVFASCSSLISINVDRNNPNYSSVNGVFYNKQQDTLICCPAGKTDEFTIPAFVTAIADRAFAGCEKLTSITVPSAVLAVGTNAFAVCTNLTAINVDAENRHYSSADGIFYNKSQDTLICCPTGRTGEIIIPNTVVTIGDEAFEFCRYLTSVIIPNSVTTIGFAAFALCYRLSSIEIGSSVTRIGYWAFYFCNYLRSITCRAISPPIIDQPSIFDLPYKANVLIPCNTLADYRDSDWGAIFANLIEDCDSGLNEKMLNEKIKLYPNPAIDKICIDYEAVYSFKIYDVYGKEILSRKANGKTEVDISNLEKGIYFVTVFSANNAIWSNKIIKR